MQVDNVVEITRSASLSERSKLLAEQFSDRVTGHSTNGQRLVAVVVPDLAQLGSLGEDFVGGEVELYLWRDAAGFVRAAIADPALGGGLAAPT